LPRPARCHPERNHWVKELCRECYTVSQRKTGKGWSPEALARRRKKNAPPLPLKHPLAADRTLHRELIKTGLSWLAVTQIRALRAQGVGVRALAGFYGIKPTTVALVTSHADLSKVVIEEVDINAAPVRRRLHPADGVHFGRSYESGAV
jgi:hypothetical protein